jgi:predicted nucleic acid-binding protein
MTELLQRAFAEITKLPDEQQDQIAARLLSELKLTEQASVADPLLLIAQLAEEANFQFTETDVSERSREILKTEYAEHLLRKLRDGNGAE